MREPVPGTHRYTVVERKSWRAIESHRRTDCARQRARFGDGSGARRPECSDLEDVLRQLSLFCEMGNAVCFTFEFDCGRRKDCPAERRCRGKGKSEREAQVGGTLDRTGPPARAAAFSEADTG